MPEFKAFITLELNKTIHKIMQLINGINVKVTT